MAKEGFEEWFDAYFCNQQGEDSPYNYDDIQAAFTAGYNLGLLIEMRKLIK